MAVGQVICYALGIACTSKADDESDIVSDIRAGYAADAYFADRKNTRNFVHKDGVYYQEVAVDVPDARAIKVRILARLCLCWSWWWIQNCDECPVCTGGLAGNMRFMSMYKPQGRKRTDQSFPALS